MPPAVLSVGDDVIGLPGGGGRIGRLRVFRRDALLPLLHQNHDADDAGDGDEREEQKTQGKFSYWLAQMIRATHSISVRSKERLG